jgi:hypothetical protein
MKQAKHWSPASASAGAPDVAPFPYGLGSWTPVGGYWLGAGASPRQAVAPTPPGLASEAAVPPAPAGEAPPSAADDLSSTGGTGASAPASGPPSWTVTVRHAYRAGRERATALDALFASCLG